MSEVYSVNLKSKLFLNFELLELFLDTHLVDVPIGEPLLDFIDDFCRLGSIQLTILLTHRLLFLHPQLLTYGCPSVCCRSPIEFS